MADSQQPLPTRSALLVAGTLLVASQAGAVSLGEADLRSFQGEPLEVRIPVGLERGEYVALECFKVRTAAGAGAALSPLGAKRFRLEESLDAATLLIRSHEPFTAPSVLLEVVARCPGAPGDVTRQYRLELPPLEQRVAAEVSTEQPMVIIQRPGEAPIVQPLASGKAASSPAKADARGTRTWRVTRGDTLDSIARGVYPKSAKMRAAFIARLREANAQALPADKEALPEGLVLNWPDLVALANASPRLQGTAPQESAVTPRKSPQQAAPETAREPAKPAVARVEPAAKVTPAGEVKASPSPAAKAESRPVATPATKGKPDGGFTLRLSGSDLDLSRSKGVSESTRAALREKQLLLDADDQVAALLSLRNTVKQLEGRLNEMQLKLSTMPPAGAAKAEGNKADIAKPPAPAQAASPAVPAVEPAKPATKIEPPAPPPVAPASAAPEVVKANPPKPQAESTGDTPKPAGKAEPPPKAAPAAATPAADESPWWLSPYLGAGVGVLALLIGLAVWARRKPREEEESGLLPAQSAHPLSSQPRSSGLGQRADEPDSIADQYGEELEREFARTTNQPAYRHPVDDDASAAGPRTDYRPQDTLRIHAPITQETEDEFFSASLELDTRPATPIDFVLGDEAGEDKSRRQRYMEERFPELASRAISVDDPDSIIDVARHHYEESELQRAVELLTYAFEERPGQLRFWLALFEIYRLEQRADDFLELASRFKNVHGGTDAWPKVQHIGRDLDPSQALYAAALGRLGVPLESDFDPVSENWLNVPMDFTSEVLMIELRQSLLAEHGVNSDRLARPLLEVS